MLEHSKLRNMSRNRVDTTVWFSEAKKNVYVKQSNKITVKLMKL